MSTLKCRRWMVYKVLHCDSSDVASGLWTNCRKRITNRQKLLTLYCLWHFILTLRPGLIMSKTSDDSLFACRNRPTRLYKAFPYKRETLRKQVKYWFLVNVTSLLFVVEYLIRTWHTWIKGRNRSVWCGAPKQKRICRQIERKILRKRIK